ncbi:MAG: hypothetical protein R8G66_11790 [Cytophagales bacterium]|nr:hypothetical protein [Cytophagales bacterium]
MAILFAALSIDPRNHGKNLRLDYLTLLALSCQNKTDLTVNPIELKRVLDQHLPHFVMEDPPVNMFTENVMTTVGNNVLFGGNFEQGAFTLNLFIKTLNYDKELFKKEVYVKLKSALTLLPWISNSIASKLGFGRNLSGEANGSEIDFQTDLEKAKYSLWIDKESVRSFCRSHKLEEEVIKDFLLTSEDVKSSKPSLEHYENSPLWSKPIIETNRGYFVISPTTILSALIHYTLVLVSRSGIISGFTTRYHQLARSDLHFQLGRIGFEKIKIEKNKRWKDEFDFELYEFDSDKIALITFTEDKGINYNLRTPCHPDPNSSSPKVLSIRSEIKESVSKSYSDKQILQIDLYSSIGREYLLYGGFEDEEYGVISTLYQLLCIIKNEDLDEMSLWYFVRAKKKFQLSVELPPFTSFIDLFAFYKVHNSFYLGDDEKPNGIMIPPGFGIDIIKKSVEFEDPLIVHHKGYSANKVYMLPVIREVSYIDKYANRENIPLFFDFYLKDFPVDVWIRANRKINSIPRDERYFYYEFGEMLCFWMNEIRSEVSQFINKLPLQVLFLSFDFENPTHFLDPTTRDEESPEIHELFKLELARDQIHIVIPNALKYYLRLANNEGERILLMVILGALIPLIELHRNETNLSPNVISQIINKVAPIGLKKMFLYPKHTSDIAYSPVNLVNPRYLQKENKQLILDDIIPELGELCPPIGDIDNNTNQLDLVKNILQKVLLPKLRSYLEGYDPYKQIKDLMALNESLLHQQALKRIQSPTRAHCFVKNEDIIEKLSSEQKRLDETNIAVRCLIEHIVAEPGTGTRQPNQQAIDDLIAIMSLIVYWGGVQDEIRYRLFNRRLMVLPSGRIGVNARETSEKYLNAFLEARSKEFLYDSTDKFHLEFSPDDLSRSKLPENLNTSFNEVFGISIFQLGGIMECLSMIGFEQNSPVYIIKIDELISRIQLEFEGKISKEQTLAALSFLSLSDRGSILDLPEGDFQINDVLPWKFTRRLSYLSRPLIQFHEADNETSILWTPRHVDRSWRYLINLLIAGRFKAPAGSALNRSISKISQKRGKKLQKEAFNILKEFNFSVLEEEVEINQKSRLKSKINLGDIDILLIDKNSKSLFSIECKKTEPARNPREMIGEVDKYFDEYFPKHQKRHDWLVINKKEVFNAYGIDFKEYSIYSLFLTNEALSLQFIRELPMPMISLYDLKTKGWDNIMREIAS